MAGSSRARGPGYGSLAPPSGDIDNSNNSSSGGNSSSHHASEGRRQSRPWLRLCIASVAVVAALGLLRSSAPTNSASPGGNHLIDPSAGSNLAEDTAYRVADAPQVSAETSAAGAGGAGAPSEEEELSFVAWNDYTRRGDVVGLGYPWLQVGELCCFCAGDPWCDGKKFVPVGFS